MGSFAERLSPSVLFERAVIERLTRSGYSAFPFGQGQLPEACRNRLARFKDGSLRPSLIRWMPDIITFRDLPNGDALVALLDAKWTGDRPNYAIEMSAIEAAELYTDRFYTPTFFVFDDWKLLAPREARQRGRPGPHTSNGSGTPYVLVDKQYARPFDSVFPPIPW